MTKSRGENKGGRVLQGLHGQAAHGEGGHHQLQGAHAPEQEERDGGSEGGQAELQEVGWGVGLGRRSPRPPSPAASREDGVRTDPAGGARGGWRSEGVLLWFFVEFPGQ